MKIVVIGGSGGMVRAWPSNPMRTEMADHISFPAAVDIAVRAPLSRADQCRVLALPYPVDYEVFWRLLGGMGVTQQRLMDRMGASP
jgi:hypothetical protein